MTFIRSISTSLAKWRYSSDQIITACANWLDEKDAALFERFSKSSRINFRHFAVPIEEVLTLKGMSQRAAIYTELGTELATDCMQKIFYQNDLDPGKIDTLIWSSCSLPTIPAIDIHVADLCKLPKTINRIPLYQHGCVGGAIGLSLAAKLCAKDNQVLVSALELCCLVHQSIDTSGGNLLGAALFADGAGCALFNHESGPLEVLGSQTFRIPDSSSALGYTINDLGTFLKLDKELPAAIAKWLPVAMQSLLKRHNLERKDISHFLAHPGGAKILESLQNDFELSNQQMHYSWDVLGRSGNISSAAIFHVIGQFMDEKSYRAGELGVVIGIGPGITLEILLFRCHL